MGSLSSIHELFSFCYFTVPLPALEFQWPRCYADWGRHLQGKLEKTKSFLDLEVEWGAQGHKPALLCRSSLSWPLYHKAQIDPKYPFKWTFLLPSTCSDLSSSASFVFLFRTPVPCSPCCPLPSSQLGENIPPPTELRCTGAPGSWRQKEPALGLEVCGFGEVSDFFDLSAAPRVQWQRLPLGVCVRLTGHDACQLPSTQEAFPQCQLPLPPTSARLLSPECPLYYLSSDSPPVSGEPLSWFRNRKKQTYCEPVVSFHVSILGAPESGCLADRCPTAPELNILLLWLFPLLFFFILCVISKSFRWNPSCFGPLAAWSSSLVFSGSHSSSVL